MDRVRIRELRQNLSVYLRRVVAGETLEVTEHGRPVAVLAPLPDVEPLARLSAAGRVRAPSRSLAAVAPPVSATLRSATAALDEQRAGER